MSLIPEAATVQAAKVLRHTSKKFALIMQYRTLRRAGLDHQSARRRILDGISSPRYRDRVETYLLEEKMREIKKAFPNGGFLAMIAIREFFEEELLLSAHHSEDESEVDPEIETPE